MVPTSPAGQPGIRVFVNDQPLEVPAGSSLAAVLVAAGFSARTGLAVACDNRVVPRAAWETTPVAAGGRLTVFVATPGG